MDRWRTLMTEDRHPASEELDTLPTAEIVNLLLEEDRRGIELALRCRQNIAIAAEWVAESLLAGGTLVFAGAGTSGRLGVLEAAECPPTFGTDRARIRALMAGGEDAVFRAKEGAEDDAATGRRDVSDLGAGDLLIGLSASSVTRYVQGALLQAREQGARTILLTCAASDGLGSQADLVIGLATGPEILTGSTRLKAGSATKAVLNAITTAAMVRLGKTYGNLMVDLRPGSAKLQDRALRIIEVAAGVSPTDAQQLHDAASGDVKVAILMGKLGLSADAADRRLADADGHLRRALES
jgi:N-acetylmuramic acid 6-phosphate etherase